MECDEVVGGVLKVNSRILEAHELRKLDKAEKGLVNAIHLTGKGRSWCLSLTREFMTESTINWKNVQILVS